MSSGPDDLKPCKTTLIGFNGEQSHPKGFIDLRFTLGVKDAFKSERVRFIVAEFVSPYNIILGRPTIHKWDMPVSTKHQKLKVIGNQGTVVTVIGDQRESRQGYFETVELGRADLHRSPKESAITGLFGPGFSDEEVNIVELDIRDDEVRPNRRERRKIGDRRPLRHH
ncbi:hypothetical protein K1719_014273 [Acacia pycnantha]|nr:hypothetical protein K1719_014273 [Acacia pycnantha]